jgi:hypothetical protein
VRRRPKPTSTTPAPVTPKPTNVSAAISPPVNGKVEPPLDGRVSCAPFTLAPSTLEGPVVAVGLLGGVG